MTATPALTTWTRVEPLTRDLGLSDGIKAKLADPLWLLFRQWQVGEFDALDAGSPVWMRLHAHASQLSRIAPVDPKAGAGQGTGLPTLLPTDGTPLDTVVEAEAEPPSDTQPWRLAAAAGQQFLLFLDRCQMRADVMPDYRAAIVAAYQLPAAAAADPIARLLIGKAPDGTRLRNELVARTDGTLPPAFPPPPEGLASIIEALRAYVAWYAVTTGTDTESRALWRPERFEYSFALEAPRTSPAGGALVLTAAEHTSGRLDWYDLDADPQRTLAATPAAPAPTAVTLDYGAVPSPARFAGMPAARFWELEDAAVNLAELSVGSENLATMAVLEYVLRYATDHYVLPIQIAPGTVVWIDQGVVVVDAFGDRHLIRSVVEADVRAGTAADFRLFEHTAITGPRDPAFLLFPALEQPADGAPLETVSLFRDEVANLVWAVEDRAMDPLSGVSTQRSHGSDDPAALGPMATMPGDPSQPAWLYKLRSPVPENWFPLLPDPTDASSLLLAGVEPVTGGTPPAPWSRILGSLWDPSGSSATQVPAEEVTREGWVVTRRWRYARGANGAQRAWIARTIQPGRGEGSSGLRFDNAVLP